MKTTKLILAGYRQATHIILFNPHISLQTRTTASSEGIWWALDAISEPRTIHKEKPMEPLDHDLPESLWCKVNQNSIDIAAVFEDEITKTTHTGTAHIAWSAPQLDNEDKA